MKVILRVDITGTRNGEEWPARGEVVDLPADAAKAVPESATVEAPENAATTPKPRSRKATGLTTKNTP